MNWRSVSRAWPFATALLATVLLPRLLAFPLLRLGPDEVAYGIIGRELMAGHWPYTTVFDHKPVALYVPYGLAGLVFGDSTTSLRALSLVVALLGFALVYALARRLGLNRGGAAALAGVYSLICVGNEGLGALSEPILNVYVLAMMLVLTLDHHDPMPDPDATSPAAPRSGRRSATGWGAVFGALLALAVNSNYLIGPVVAVLGLYFLVRSGWHSRGTLGAVLGFVGLTGALLVPVALYSDLSEYFTLQFSFLGAYEGPPAAWDVLAVRVQKFLAPLVAVVGLPFAALVLRHRDNGPGPRLAWPVVLLVVSVMTAGYSRFFFAHYSLIIAPAVVLLAALAIRTITRARARTVFVGALLAVSFWTMVVPTLPNLVQGATAIRRQHDLAPDETAPELQVALALREVVKPGDLIYALDLHNYLLTGGVPATRFFFPIQHLSHAYAAAHHSTPEQEVRGILARFPTAVVVSPWQPWPVAVRPLVDSYLKDHCQKWKRLRGSTIYTCSAG